MLEIKTAEETKRRIEEIEGEKGHDAPPRTDEPNDHNAASGSSPGVAVKYGEFKRRQFADGEQIVFHAGRGELVLIQSVTNKGKSTLARNVAMSLATGRAFPPVLSSNAPRSVYLLNFEGAGGRFHADLLLMEQALTQNERELLDENLSVEHRPKIDGEFISLSRHMRLVEEDARKNKADVIVIDTASAAFNVRDENANAEITNHVLKPLVNMAERLQCVVVLIHHIGKGYSEEGRTRESAHKGRGASAWADFSTSILNLEADAGDQNLVTLECAKRKDGGNYKVRLKLNGATRWFELLDGVVEKPLTSREKVRAAVTREMHIDEIVGLSGVTKRTAERRLSEELKDGYLMPGYKPGWYAPKTSAATATTYVDGGSGGGNGSGNDTSKSREGSAEMVN